MTVRSNLFVGTANFICRLKCGAINQQTVINEREEGLLHQQLGVEHDQLGRRWYQVVALVEFEELHEDLRLILLCK